MEYLILEDRVITLAQTWRAKIYPPDYAYDRRFKETRWDPHVEEERKIHYTFRLDDPPDGAYSTEIYRGTLEQCRQFQASYIYFLNNGSRAERIESIVKRMN